MPKRPPPSPLNFSISSPDNRPGSQYLLPTLPTRPLLLPSPRLKRTKSSLICATGGTRGPILSPTATRHSGKKTEGRPVLQLNTRVDHYRSLTPLTSGASSFSSTRSTCFSTPISSLSSSNSTGSNPRRIPPWLRTSSLYDLSRPSNGVGDHNDNGSRSASAIRKEITDVKRPESVGLGWAR